jgi:ketosteroid isomerase-like protein
MDASAAKGFDASPLSGLLSGTPMTCHVPKRAAVAFVTGLLLCSVQPGWSQDAPAPKKPIGISHLGEHKRAAHTQIEALETQWQQAQLAGDAPAMDKLLSDDYLGITATGEVVTKAQQLDHMRARKLTVTNLVTSDLKIKLIGQIAIVTSRAQLDGTSDGDPLHGEFRYTRVYQRLPNGVWKITNFEATRIPRSQATKRTAAQPQ